MSRTLGQLAGETLQIGIWNFPLSGISQLVSGARTIQSFCLLLVEDSVHLP
ncbi:hypothetical protein N657DRAFT_647916 [Parathielavia appendiculata]|uniref:Uncharacterized protein n=1 Tax=Parathielavia appendiculata TaxID=2587402 RepID=A0AAN6Z2L3_9PEZI|nr:hypothetical protein N657DRAFT_647916 [Parathielavia appendiculata]